MPINNIRPFLSSLTLGQKVRFLLIKLLRGLASEIGRKNYFNNLYEFARLSNVRGASFRTDSSSYRVKFEGQEYRLRRNSSDTDVFVQVILKNEHRFIADTVRRNKFTLSTMIDAGANVGLTSMLFAHTCPGIQILAIEPDKGNFLALEQNLKLLNHPSVKAVYGGITPYSGWLVPEETFGDNRGWARSFRMSADQQGEASIPGFSIMDIVKREAWEEISFLKMDIEGGEKAIFLPDSGYLSFLPMVKIIAIEIHDSGNLRETILGILRDHHFMIMDQGELTIGIRNGLV